MLQSYERKLTVTKVICHGHTGDGGNQPSGNEGHPHALKLTPGLHSQLHASTD